MPNVGRGTAHMILSVGESSGGAGLSGLRGVFPVCESLGIGVDHVHIIYTRRLEHLASNILLLSLLHFDQMRGMI